MKIGFIGTGIMGSRMAMNLLTAGYDLQIYNRTPSKLENLLEQGAEASESPAELAGAVDVLITMLAHPDAITALALNHDTAFLDIPERKW